MLALFITIQACGTKKAAEKDQFFEEWRVMAEQSKGHSPEAAPEKEDISESLLAAEILEQEAQGVSQEAPKSFPTMPVTLRMTKSNIVAVLRALARAADQNLAISSSVQGEINIDVKETPWDQVFNGILRTNGLAYTWEGDIIRVMTLTDMEHDLSMDAIKEKRKAQEMTVKRVEPLLTSVINIDYGDAKKLQENLKEFLTKDEQGKPRGSVLVDEHTNSIIIQAIRDDIVKMIPLIERLDRPTPQILIKANIVETTKDIARDLGVQWGGLYSTTSGNDNLYLTPGGTNGSSRPGGPEAGNYDPVSGVSGISGQGLAVNFPVAEDAIISGGGIASMGLLFGKIGSNILELQLSALQAEGKLNILSSPSITTLDNQTAFTENGERVPYVHEDKEGNRLVSFEDAVLRLEITPHVIEGENLKIRIKINKDEVDTSRTVEGNPLIIKKQTETSLIAHNGETIVISGLSRQRSAGGESGVPGLKDVPVLGHLFKGRSNSERMEEVIIFITPEILSRRSGDKTPNP
jgi:type IV pilus assembly protein PilQ